MGEVFHYHITMLVTGEQEDAIRAMFKHRNWSCCINVLPEETVTNIRESGYAYAFPDTPEIENTDTLNPGFTEIKTEVFTADCSDTDSASDGFCSAVFSERLEMSAVHAADVCSDVAVAAQLPYTEDTSSSCTESTQVFLSTSTTSRETTQGDTDVEVKKLVNSSTNMKPSKASDISSFHSEHKGSDSLTTGLTSGSQESRFITTSSQVGSGRCRISASGYVMETSRDLNPASLSANTRHLSKALKRKSCQKIKILSQNRKICKTVPEENKSLIRGDCPKLRQDKMQTRKEKEGSCEENKNNSKQPYNGAFNYVLCVDCPSRFFTWEDLWKHRNEVQHDLPTEKPYGWAKRNYSPEELQSMGYMICSACNNYFPDRRKLRQHCYALHRELMPRPSCPICGEEFSSHKDLHKHKREQQHNDSLWLLNSYQCDVCGKQLTKYDNFRQHKQLSCGKTELELEALRIHQCEICGKRFKSLKAVRVHVNIVHEKTEAVCDICGKVCKSKFALRGHKRRHNEKNRKFVCGDCGKAFFASSLLIQHMRTHTKEKPFKCPLCDYICSVRENVHKHARNVHKQNVTAVDLRKSGIAHSE